MCHILQVNGDMEFENESIMLENWNRKLFVQTWKALKHSKRTVCFTPRLIPWVVSEVIQMLHTVDSKQKFVCTHN